MGGAVDAECGSRHDREAAIDQSARDLDRDVLAVARGRPGAHDRDRATEAAEDRRIAPHPERHRRVHPEVVEAGRPLGVAGDDEPRPESGRLPQVQGGVDLPHARTPALGGLGERAARGGVHRARAGGQQVESPHGAHRGDQPAGIGIPGFGDRRPSGPGVPLADLVAVEPPVGNEGAHEHGEVGVRGHAAARLSSRARPTCAASGRSTPSRSASVQAILSTRS